MDTKNIKVFNTREKELAPTSLRIAKTLVARDKAVWIEEGKSLTLLYTKSEFKKLKKQVIEEEGRRCYICGEKIDITEAATIDHVYPKSRYGKDSRDNLRCCCKKCNDDKGNMNFYQYYNHIMANIENYSYIDFENLEKEKVKYIRAS